MNKKFFEHSCKNFKTLVGFYFATNPKMVLINIDQCINADIVLDVGFNLKKLNHPSTHDA